MVITLPVSCERIPTSPIIQKKEIVEEVANGKNIQYRLVVCLDTAEEILRFAREVQNEIIIQNFETPEIEIYDGYRE